VSVRCLLDQGHCAKDDFDSGLLLWCHVCYSDEGWINLEKLTGNLEQRSILMTTYEVAHL
jgi:hypothetical protein